MAQNFGDELKRYYELTPKSRALFEEGKQFLPGSWDSNMGPGGVGERSGKAGQRG